ncbi:hypothetical protein, partial [Yersinia pseudotuberculosis]
THRDAFSCCLAVAPMTLGILFGLRDYSVVSGVHSSQKRQMGTHSQRFIDSRQTPPSSKEVRSVVAGRQIYYPTYKKTL